MVVGKAWTLKKNEGDKVVGRVKKKPERMVQAFCLWRFRESGII